MDTQLIEKMIDAVFARSEAETGATLSTWGDSRNKWRKWLGIAYEVAEQHILAEIAGPVTDEEMDANRKIIPILTRHQAEALIASRIAKYKAPKERVTVEPVEIQVPTGQREKALVYRVLCDDNAILFEHADEQYAKAIAQVERERMKAGGK